MVTAAEIGLRHFFVVNSGCVFSKISEGELFNRFGNRLVFSIFLQHSLVKSVRCRRIRARLQSRKMPTRRTIKN